MTDRNCPKCGGEMAHQEAEEDVGINGGWSCLACDYGEPDELPDGEFDYDR